MEMGLVDLAVQALDGTIITGIASTVRTYNAVTLLMLRDRTESALAIALDEALERRFGTGQARRRGS